jgi:hypothetical protein
MFVFVVLLGLILLAFNKVPYGTLPAIITFALATMGEIWLWTQFDLFNKLF